MEKLLNFLSTHWRLLLTALGLALITYILLFRGISTLTGNYAAPEVNARNQSISVKTIYNHPVNAPHEALVWVGIKLGHNGIAVTRVASAIIATVAAILFYWVAIHWYSKRVALVSTILFVSSSGFLHFGRYGDAQILQMATLVLISCVFLFRRARQEKLAAYGIVAVLAACLYIPVIVWFELIGLVLMRHRILYLFRKLGQLHTSLLILFGTLLTLPLLIRFIIEPESLRVILGLPSSIPAPALLLDNFMHLCSSIVYKGYWPTEYWMYGAPLLNAAESILLIAGLIMLVRRPILRGNYYLIGTLVTSTVLITLGGSATIALLVPLIYLTIAGGIYYLLNEWLKVFPKNPIARYTGMTLLMALAVFSVLYHFRAYYTAWPNAPETKSVYTIKQPS